MRDYNPGLLDSSFFKDTDLNLSQLWPQKQLLVSWAELGGVLTPLLSSALMKHIWRAGSSSVLPSTREAGREIQERFQHRAIKMINGWEHLQYKERLEGAEAV